MPASHAIRVLVVDDHEDTREMYAAYLTRLGMKVKTAEDGAHALEVAARWVPDVVVMDLSMPHVAGDAAARAFKADPRTRRAAILLITAYGFLGRAKARAASVDAFCRKPCAPPELAELVRQLAELCGGARKRPSAAGDPDHTVVKWRQRD